MKKLFIFMLLFLMAPGLAHAEPKRVYFDWTPWCETNDTLPEDANGPYNMYIFSATSCWANDTAWSNTQDIAGDSTLIVSVDLLHCRTNAYYDNTTRDWVAAQGAVLRGKYALDENGAPSVRWWDVSCDNYYDKYHVDPRLTTPQEYVDTIVAFINDGHSELDGIFFDYMAEAPYTYDNIEYCPDEPEIAIEWINNQPIVDQWKAYQILVVYYLRQAMGEDFIIIANGPWAMQEPALVQDYMLSGVYWEKMGILWTPTKYEGFYRTAKDRSGIHIFDSNQLAGDGSIYDFKADADNNMHVDQLVAGLLDQYYVAYRK